MALAIDAVAVDVIDNFGPSSEMGHQLPVIDKLRYSCISHLYSSKRHFSHPSLLTRQSALSVWWLGLSHQLTQLVERCSDCAKKHTPNEEPHSQSTPGKS